MRLITPPRPHPRLLPRAAGTFFRTMSLEERRAFARQEGIPFFIRWILLAQAGSFERCACCRSHAASPCTLLVHNDSSSRGLLPNAGVWCSRSRRTAWPPSPPDAWRQCTPARTFADVPGVATAAMRLQPLVY